MTAWGIAVVCKNTGLGGGAPNHAGAAVELRPDTVIEVSSSPAEFGQNLPKVLKLIAAKELEVSTKTGEVRKVRLVTAVGVRSDRAPANQEVVLRRIREATVPSERAQQPVLNPPGIRPTRPASIPPQGSGREIPQKLGCISRQVV